jgi:hypothetical protein
MKGNLYKHTTSGNVYTCLGIINHKDEVTREWVEHILYKGAANGVFYTRTVTDFKDNFELLKL